MAFDVKKEYKDLYQPAATPSIIEVPRMRFVAVEGSGDPNEEGGDYQTALQLLYGVSFTIKMSRKSKDPAEHIEATTTTWCRRWRACGTWTRMITKPAPSIIRARRISSGPR